MINISTPTFNDQSNKETTLKLDESGCIAENILFKAKIDWIESAEKGFNLDVLIIAKDLYKVCLIMMNLILIKFLQKLS